MFTPQKSLKVDLDLAVAITALSAPVFSLIIRGWAGWLLGISALLASFILFASTKEVGENYSAAPADNKIWARLIVLMLISPTLAIFISQTLRQEYSWNNYDAPSKFLLAIPLFFAILRSRIRINQMIPFIFPLALIVTIIGINFLPRIGWGGDPTRLSSYFVDPLTFGRVTISFALLCIASINFYKPSSWANLLQIIGALSGIYLSIRSGSRTGWLAVPIVLFMLFWMKSHLSMINKIFIGLALCTLATLSAYYSSPTVKERADLAINEVKTYQLNTLNPDNSVGMRISFLRMGVYYFSMAPLSGWGDKGFKDHLNDAEISKFASQYTREFAFSAGFHNELVTNAVRSGIWGILSTLLMFFVPIALLLKKSAPQKEIVTLGLTYIVCEMISGMSTEVLNLKFTAAIYATMIAVLCGIALNSNISKIYESK